MTEAEWLATNDPESMLGLLVKRFGDRKVRLFAVECARSIWPLLKFDASRRAVEVAERYAEGMATPDELTEARHAANLLSTQGLGGTKTYPASRCAHACTDLRLYRMIAVASRHAISAGNRSKQMAVQRDFIRCVFGPTAFRPVTFDPCWQTETVVSLAEGIYADRAFDRLPILADALQDAGCENADILAHCRGDGPHVRGCWVVDLVLGKQ